MVIFHFLSILLENVENNVYLCIIESKTLLTE